MEMGILTILSREEFVKHFNGIKPGLGNPTSPLWNPEEYLKKNQCYWFIKVKPIISSVNKIDYWTWCNQCLQGKVLCYSSDDIGQEEWWGFSNKNDIVLWSLRWIHG